MKKEYKKSVAEIAEFAPEDDIMTNGEDDVYEPDTSMGYDEW